MYWHDALGSKCLHVCICGSPVQKSKIIPSRISIALLCSKRRIAELPLRAGFIRASQMHEQSKNHISLIKQTQMLHKVTHCADTFQPIPGLISCTGVTQRWELLYHAQNGVRWLALFKTWWRLLAPSLRAAVLRAAVLRCMNIYEVHTSPALNRSSVIRRFERSNVIEIRDRIIFDFYMGLPHDLQTPSIDLCLQK